MIITNKKRFYSIITGVSLFIILIILLMLSHAQKESSIDLTNSLHALIASDDVKLYYEKNKYLTLSKGEPIFILQNHFISNTYTIFFEGRIGDIAKSDVKYYQYQPHEKHSLMVDVSEFNMRDNFKNASEFAFFVIDHGINYVYMRLGGRGYGEKGNMYYDSKVDDYINICDFLNIPYGFYYLDEALNEEEVLEEVHFVKRFLNEHPSKMNLLPLAIDLEFQEGAGRADSIWKERTQLLESLMSEFKKEGVSCILYANAKRANDYLSSLESDFWIARYPQNGIIPNSTFKEFITLEQTSSILNTILDNNYKIKTSLDKNKEFVDSYSDTFLNKIIGWQFTADGASKDGIEESIDLSLVSNAFFKKYVEQKNGDA